MLTVLPADVVSLEWVWNDPQFEDGGVITSTDVASWVWVGYQRDEQAHGISLGEEVKGMIDTGVDEDADQFIDALRGVYGRFEVAHEDRESYQVFTGTEVPGREEFARNVLVALQSANRECERRGGIC